MSDEDLKALQAEHDKEFAKAREEDRETLARNEAANYLRTHDAEAAQEYQSLMATRRETDQPEEETE